MTTIVLPVINEEFCNVCSALYSQSCLFEEEWKSLAPDVPLHGHLETY